MDWQNLFSPQLWGTFAPYLIVNMLLAAAFGWIGGWLSHRWTSRRDNANWERDWKADLLRERRAKLEQIITEIRESTYTRNARHPKLDETEREWLSQLGGIVTMKKNQDDQDIDKIASIELPTEFFLRLIDIDATPTWTADATYYYALDYGLTTRELLQLVDDGRVLRQEIDRLTRELGIKDW